MEENKSYTVFKKWIKSKIIKNEEIENSDFYRYIVHKFRNENLEKKVNLFIANVQSMCVEKNPDAFRIRNDKFLKLAKEKKFGILLSGLKINETKFILCFFTKSFRGYPFSNNSSNSFINFTKKDLESKIISFQFDNISIKNGEKKSKKLTKYIFYVVNCDKFDVNKFNLFWDEINKLEFDPYSSNCIKFFVPPIPEESKIKSRELFSNFCALATENGNFSCPCGKNIDVNFLKVNKLNYTDIHHFVPKELLIRTMNESIGFLDWNEIHDDINLIPLCSPCHQAIHKKNTKYAELIKNTFDSIINCYKAKNKYEKFLVYLKNNANMNIEDLFNFYCNNSESI